MSSRTDTLSSIGLLLWVLIGIPVLTIIALQVPRRIVARRRTTGYDVEAKDAAFVSVDPLVRTGARGRFIRRSIVAVAVIAALSALVWFSPQLPGSSGLTFVLFGGTFALVFLVWLVVWTAWRPHPLLTSPRRRSGFRLSAVMSVIVRGFAVVLGAVALELYVVLGVFLWDDSRAGGFDTTTPLPTEGDPLALGIVYARFLMLLLVQNGLVVLVFFGFLALPLFVAYLIDRFRSAACATLSFTTP